MPWTGSATATDPSVGSAVVDEIDEVTDGLPVSGVTFVFAGRCSCARTGNEKRIDKLKKRMSEAADIGGWTNLKVGDAN
jgi:hypothetical protein